MGKTIYDIFGTCKESEQKGIRVDYGDGIVFRVARMGSANSSYAQYLKARFKPYKHQIDTDTLPDAIAQEILLSSFVKYVLLGWEGVTDRDGAAIPFSEDNAKKLLTDMPDLYADLQSVARDYTNFLECEREETAKNYESA